MKKIHKPERLVGCNVKVVKSLSVDFFSASRIGQIYKIKDSVDLGYYVQDDTNPDTSFDFEEIKLILDDKFLEVFKKEKIAVNCRTQEEADVFCKFIKHNSDFWCWDKEEKVYFYEDYVPNGCNVNNVKEKGYTIIKFKDLILHEEDYMEEFIEYWKNNRVAIKFDNTDDKKAFTKRFDDICQNYGEHWDFYVYWGNNEWRHTDVPKSYYKIINYEDIKNWKEILLNKKGDTMEPYKIIKPISIKNLIDSDICNDVLAEGIKEFNKKGYNLKGDFWNWNAIKDFDVIKNNIDWLIEEGFIEEYKDFKPFDITFKIENEDQLLSLYHKLNSSNRGVKDGSDEDDFNFPRNWHSLYFFNQVNDEMWRLEN